MNPIDKASWAMVVLGCSKLEKKVACAVLMELIYDAFVEGDAESARELLFRVQDLDPDYFSLHIQKEITESAKFAKKIGDLIAFFGPLDHIKRACQT